MYVLYVCLCVYNTVQHKRMIRECVTMNALLYILHLFTMYSMLFFHNITVLKGLVYSDHLQVI